MISVEIYKVIALYKQNQKGVWRKEIYILDWGKEGEWWW